MGIDIRLERFDVYTHCVDMRRDDDDDYCEHTVDDDAACAVVVAIVVVVAVAVVDVIVAAHIYAVDLDIGSLDTYVCTQCVDMQDCMGMQYFISTRWVYTYVSRDSMSIPTL